MGRSSKGKRGAELTERERFWLKHHAACVASGMTAMKYASAHGLSVHALYQARKRLREEGKLPQVLASGGQRTRRQAAPRFAKVAALPALGGPARTRYRVRFGSGALVEWEGPAEANELESVLRAVSTLG